MRHTSPKEYRQKYGPAPNMARVAEEAERLQREGRSPKAKPDPEADYMREHGVSAEQIDAYMRGEW